MRKTTTILFILAATMFAAEETKKLSTEQKNLILGKQVAAMEANQKLLMLQKDPTYAALEGAVNKASAELAEALEKVKKEAGITENCRLTKDLDIKCEEPKKEKK